MANTPSPSFKKLQSDLNRNNKADLRILFWNARSINKHKEEMEVILKDIDLFICVESWLSENQNISYAGFDVYRKDRRHSRGGGILILISKKILFREIANIHSSHESVELCGIRLINTKPSLDLFVCYRTPGFTLSDTQWNEIINCSALSENCILAGDFNAHHTFWNCARNDPNGIKLYDAIENSNLFVLNHNSLTHVDRYRNKKSNLDLILCSLSMADKINIKINDETWGSDHYPIYATCNISKQLYYKKSFKIHSVRTNWENVSKKLDDEYYQFLCHDYDSFSPIQKYDYFFNIVKNAIKENSSRKKIISPQLHRNPVCWWEAECATLKTERKEASKKWERSHLLEDLINYNKANATLKKVFKSKKIANFRKFAETIDFKTNANYTWNKCKILKNKWISTKSTNITHNCPTDTEKATAINKISPPWVQTDPNYLPKCNNHGLHT